VIRSGNQTLLAGKSLQIWMFFFQQAIDNFSVWGFPSLPCLIKRIDDWYTHPSIDDFPIIFPSNNGWLMAKSYLILIQRTNYISVPIIWSPCVFVLLLYDPHYIVDNLYIIDNPHYIDYRIIFHLYPYDIPTIPYTSRTSDRPLWRSAFTWNDTRPARKVELDTFSVRIRRNQWG